MYRFEIMWKEPIEGLGRLITKFRGFKSREQYEKFARRLEKKGCEIIGRIEDFERVA